MNYSINIADEWCLACNLKIPNLAGTSDMEVQLSIICQSKNLLMTIMFKLVSMLGSKMSKTTVVITH